MPFRESDFESARPWPQTPATGIGGSIAVRLTLWFTLFSFVLLIANTIVAYWGFTVAMENEDDEHLLERVRQARAALRRHADDSDRALAKLFDSAETGRYTDFLVRAIDSLGKTVAETPGMDRELPIDAFPRPKAEAERGGGIELETTSGDCYRVIAIRFPAEGRFNAPYLLQVAMNRTYEMQLMARQRTYLAAFLLASLAMCAFAGWWIVRRHLAPIDRMKRTARHIGSKTLGDRMDVASMPVELAELAATFNDMLDRLQDAFRRLGQFSSSIAHELRTPVNNLRGEIEVSLGQARTEADYRETLGSVLEESQRLGQLIDSLLFLARAEDPRAEVQRRPIPLAAELNKLADFHEAAAGDAQVQLLVECPDDLKASADPTLLHRAIANLLTNALDHTPAGGTIQLRGRATASGVAIDVVDSGKGIPSDALPYVFDRFFRVDPSRTGGFGRSGLGLALVRSIAQLHGGSATIASEMGKGTTVTLEFPPAPTDLHVS